MASRSTNRNAIIQSTLFHIQLKQCQYIDDFPEAVADVFEKNVHRGRLKKYQDLKRKLYRIKTSFFDVNKDIRKKEFFESLYDRIKRLIS